MKLPEQVDGRNVLVLPRGTDVVALATAWFPDAAWAREPVTRRRGREPRPMTGARFRGMVAERRRAGARAAGAGPARDARGPDAARPGRRPAAGLGARDVDLYALDSTDASGVPLVYGWMSAAARRAAGGIVPADRSRLVVPDPGAAVDLTLWSPLAAVRADALPLVRPAMSGARVGRPTSRSPRRRSAARPITATFEYDGAITVRTGRGRGEIPVALSHARLAASTARGPTT